MKILSNPKELLTSLKELKGSIGFVPTMGALHQGHLSLIKKSVMENDHTIVSIFVNPTQFLPNEDLSTYPRRLEADIKLCSLAKVSLLFTPSYEDLYFEDEVTLCAPSKLGYVLEGFSRPSHFDGVLRVIMKLFNLVKPTRAYFGKKDAQQLKIVEKMVNDLFLNIEIIPCEIIRDEEGLALSSRNAYLSNEEKKDALKISKALELASKEVVKGNKDIKKIEELMGETLAPLKIEYAKVLRRDFTALNELEIGNSIILICAHVGSTRLIDNIWI